MLITVKILLKLSDLYHVSFNGHIRFYLIMSSNLGDHHDNTKLFACSLTFPGFPWMPAVLLFLIFFLSNEKIFFWDLSSFHICQPSVFTFFCLIHQNNLLGWKIHIDWEFGFGNSWNYVMNSTLSCHKVIFTSLDWPLTKMKLGHLTNYTQKRAGRELGIFCFIWQFDK